MPFGLDPEGFFNNNQKNEPTLESKPTDNSYSNSYDYSSYFWTGLDYIGYSLDYSAHFVFNSAKSLGNLMYSSSSWLYKWLTNSPPVDSKDFEIWQKQQIENQKQAQLQNKLDLRKIEIRKQHSVDKNYVDQKLRQAQNWASNTKKNLQSKLQQDENLAVSLQNRENPERTPGWSPEPVDKTFFSEQLCEDLGCSSSSSSKVGFPKLSSSSSKNCLDKNLENRELERTLANCQRDNENIYKYYEEKIETLLQENSLQKNQGRFLELPSGSIETPVDSVDSGPDLGIFNIFKLPADIASGETFKLSKNMGLLVAPMKFFELFIALLICLCYLIVGYAIFHVIKFSLEYIRESTKHWAENRREMAKFKLEQERRELLAKRRRKNRREFGKSLDRFIDGTAKKGASLIHTVRGGQIIPIDEIEPSTLTDLEIDKILFYYDPIHIIVQIEKIRSELYELSKIYKKRTRVREKFNSIFRFIYPNTTSLSSKLSSIIGWLTIAAAGSNGMGLVGDNSATRLSTQSYQIEQTLTNNNKLEVKMIEKTLENLETEIESSQSSKKATARKKSRKFNRKIRTLNDLPTSNSSVEKEVDEALYDFVIKRSKIKIS